MNVANGIRALLVLAFIGEAIVARRMYREGWWG